MIVVPGTIVGKVKRTKIIGPHIKYNGNIVATTVSLLEKKAGSIKLTPLSGVYVPNKDDIIIGKIVDVLPNGWIIEMNSPYLGFMLIKDALYEFIDPSKDDLNNYFTYGDFIVAKILHVTRNRIINVGVKGEGLGKLHGGMVISINTKKVPRVIGKNKSMLNMIKEVTGASIIVGQNGRIWIKSDRKDIELLVAKAIKMIERYSHVKGLTDKIKRFLETNINPKGINNKG